jgi:hypothetical protein
VIVILENDRDTLLQVDHEGYARLTTDSKARAAVGASLGLSGMKSIDQDGQVIIALNPIAIVDSIEKSIAAVYVFGVYDTDTNGDVRFRYRFNFSYFYCSTSLPGWPYGDPNPNHWMNWNILDFSPWSGKKLLVPRRYQYWHQIVYGFSISRTLLLVANS